MSAFSNGKISPSLKKSVWCPKHLMNPDSFLGYVSILGTEYNPVFPEKIGRVYKKRRKDV